MCVCVCVCVHRVLAKCSDGLYYPTKDVWEEHPSTLVAIRTRATLNPRHPVTGVRSDVPAYELLTNPKRLLATELVRRHSHKHGTSPSTPVAMQGTAGTRCHAGPCVFAAGQLFRWLAYSYSRRCVRSLCVIAVQR